MKPFKTFLSKQRQARICLAATQSLAASSHRKLEIKCCGQINWQTDVFRQKILPPQNNIGEPKRRLRVINQGIAILRQFEMILVVGNKISATIGKAKGIVIALDERIQKPTHIADKRNVHSNIKDLRNPVRKRVRRPPD